MRKEVNVEFVILLPVDTFLPTLAIFDPVAFLVAYAVLSMTTLALNTSGVPLTGMTTLIFSVFFASCILYRCYLQVIKVHDLALSSKLLIIYCHSLLFV